ncbi:helix-turn-helix domain-containing protein [Sorangium sp. So ce542]|uniref:helix-turn-helix domain-containing protein n=1 Tax=Sorangium sp. So ce542 TaxID=3133316 RepID=UPI003F6072F1
MRAALSTHREQQRRGKDPSELRKQAEAYAKERCRAGATPTETATELGVRKVTADRWVSAGEPADEGVLPATSKSVESFPLMPVVVRPERREAPSLRLKLAFADGTRMQVSGIGARDLVEAIEALRRGR